MSTADAASGDLGRRINTLRRKRGLSLKTVAEASDVSESFLSQVERGKTSPSIASLHRIAAALGQSVPALFTGDDQPARLVRVADRGRLFHSGRGEEDMLLTPRNARHMQLIQTNLEPGQGSGDELYAHGGEEECVLILSGQLKMTVIDQTYDLAEGDVLLLDPSEPHGYVNDGDQETVILWVTVPPP